MLCSPLKGKAYGALALLCILPLCATIATAQTIVSETPLPGSPGGVAVDPITHKAFVAITGMGEVAVLDEKSNLVVDTISIGADPVDVAVNPFTKRLYVADTYTSALYVLDAKTYSYITTIPIPAASIAVNSVTDKVYVSDFFGKVYVVDGRTSTVVATIPVSSVQSLAVNPITNRIYAAQNLFPGKVTVIDGKTDRAMTSITMGGFLTDSVAVDPLHNTVYATDQFAALDVIDGATNRLKSTLSLPGQPSGLSVDPFTRRVYVNDLTLDNVQIVDGNNNTLSGSIPAGVAPTYSAFDMVRGLLYVSNSANGGNYDPANDSVTVISTRPEHGPMEKHAHPGHSEQ